MLTAVAHLPNGSYLSYLDSGPGLDSDNFTTVITFHGLSFNAHGFEPLFPLAHRHNIRLVVVQRKDYAGSSQYTEEEIRLLDENPGEFLARMGVLCAQFVHYIAVNTRVCKPTKDRLEGGITIMGWSLGTVFAMSMFANQGVLDKEAYALVESYITNLVIYDPPHVALGVTFSDFTGVPDEEPPTFTKGASFDKSGFHTWVSCSYDHPEEWDGTPSKLDRRPRTNECIFESWSDTEKDKYTETFGLRSDLPIRREPAQTYVRQLAEAVLFSNDPTLRAFPLVRVTFIHGKRSIWMATLAWHVTRKKQEDLLSQGHGSNVRPMKIKVIEWGNHFIHSENTKKFMKIISEAIRADPELEAVEKVKLAGPPVRVFPQQL